MRAAVALAVALLVAGCGSEQRGAGRAVKEPPPHARWGMPAGGGRPKAVVMLIHPGGWKGEDPRAFGAMLELAPAYQRLGYATLTIDYRRGATGIDDADRF